ncbi:hypothetical protein ES703_10859 [subsurface metagenome]
MCRLFFIMDSVGTNHFATDPGTQAANNTIPISYFVGRFFHSIFFGHFLNNIHIRAAGQETLQDGFPIFSDSLGVGEYLYAFLGRINTGRDQSSLISLHQLDAADTTAGMRPYQLMITQSGNCDSYLLGILYYGYALFALDRMPVNLEGYIIILCHSSDTFVAASYCCRN